MTTDTDLADAPEAEGALAAPVEAENTAPQADQRDYEAEAREMGWLPPGEFKGDPTKAVDAETFVKRGEEFIPFLKAANKRLEKQVEQVTKTLAKFKDHHDKTEQRAYDRALKDLKAELAIATKAGDEAAVEEIADQLADLKAEATPKGEAPTHDAEIIDAWIAENAWYKSDDVMAAAAAAIASKLESQGLTDTAKQLAEVTKRIKAEFPHKFENPRRREAGAVEAPGAGRAARGKTYADLPPDAKKMCDEFVRDIPGFKREAYVKDYFGSDQ
jgi:hypothetical protein